MKSYCALQYRNMKRSDATIDRWMLSGHGIQKSGCIHSSSLNVNSNSRTPLRSQPHSGSVRNVCTDQQAMSTVTETVGRGWNSVRRQHSCPICVQRCSSPHTARFACNVAVVRIQRLHTALQLGAEDKHARRSRTRSKWLDSKAEPRCSLCKRVAMCIADTPSEFRVS